MATTDDLICERVPVTGWAQAILLAAGQGDESAQPPLGQRVMAVMTRYVDQMAAHLRPQAGDAHQLARARWIAGGPLAGSLTQARVECWHYLDAKNGNSTTIADANDVVTRALICVLYDEPDAALELGDTLEFFSWLLDRYDGLGGTVELVTSNGPA